MTQLDAAVLALLLLIAAGGHRQGLIRGIVRTAALCAIGLIAGLFSFGVATNASLNSVLLRLLASVAGIVFIVCAAAWLVNGLIPQRFHRSRINRAFGVVPALVQGMLVLALVLGLAHRLAFEQSTQKYIARGIVTGRLIEPVSWLERAVAGLR